MSRNRNVLKKLDKARITNQIVPRSAWSNSQNHEHKKNNFNCDSINDNLDDYDLEISDQLSSGKSTSSSSLSWAEDCEADATKLVAEEYERMLRVLHGLELIPVHYDKDEYKLWIKTFPCLSLMDRSSASSTKTLTNIEADTSSGNRDGARQNTSTSIQNVIVNPFGSPKMTEPAKLRRIRSIRNKIPPNNDRNIINTTLNPMTLEEELYSFLTISNRPETRRSVYSNKFYGNDVKSPMIGQDKFSSLPPLFDSTISNRSSIRRKSSAYRKSDSSQFPPVLEADWSKQNGKFRSISAVPKEFLHVNKCPSALPVNNREGTARKLLAQDTLSKQRKQMKKLNEFADFESKYYL